MHPDDCPVIPRPSVPHDHGMHLALQLVCMLESMMRLGVGMKALGGCDECCLDSHEGMMRACM